MHEKKKNLQKNMLIEKLFEISNNFSQHIYDENLHILFN